MVYFRKMQPQGTSVTPRLTKTQQARRRAIIAAAINVINRDGYIAASIEKIATEANTNKSTVLYHFKSKEALNHALVGDLFEEGAAYMSGPIQAAQTYREKLQAYLTSNLQYIAKHAEHIAAVHSIQQHTAPWGGGDEPVKWLEQMLIDGQKVDEFGTFDAHITALIIRLTIDSASVYFTINRSLDVDHYIRETAQLFDKVVTKN